MKGNPHNLLLFLLWRGYPLSIQFINKLKTEPMEGLTSSEKQMLSQIANEQLSTDNLLDWSEAIPVCKCTCSCDRPATQYVGSFPMCNHHADIAMLAAH